LDRALVSSPWEVLARLRGNRTIQTAATFALVTLGPVLATITFLTLGPLQQGASSTALRAIFLADLAYVLIVTGLVLVRVAGLVAARRQQSAGSQLHLRLSGLFAAIALGPAVLVAVFAGVTINIGLEGWFSERVRNVIGASLAAAVAYEDQQRRDITADAEALANFLERARAAGGGELADGDMRLLLQQGQLQIQRGLSEAFVIDRSGAVRSRGERSYLFYFERPTDAEIGAALGGQTVLIPDWPTGELRALVALEGFDNLMLSVTRQVDGTILGLLDETQQTAKLYAQLETVRGRILFEFGLLYLAFALLLVLAAVWLGLWFAERLARPVARLAGAAQRVGEGDLEARVPVAGAGDDLDRLGEAFNSMTAELKVQRDALIEKNRETEEQRRLFDSVLTSVSAGVIGLDAEGRIGFANPSALRLLALDEGAALGRPLDALVPEFAPLFGRLRAAFDGAVQDEVRLSRRGKAESLLVRMGRRAAAPGQGGGFVVAFDDVTELVSAQRVAAWGDVARRIAHEIKNPLTPIQLSAERIRRRFAPGLQPDQAESLAQYVDVIVRQTGDLRRIVDEFSRFARMPEPDRKPHDLVRILRDAVLLQESAQPAIAFDLRLPGGGVAARVDATLMSQALTNLLKNAGEAIEGRIAQGVPQGYVPRIQVELRHDAGVVEISIADNGIGLPEDRARLFEPYVTLRPGGTGLGLPIVRKIIEDHGGTLTLTDAPADPLDNRRGALALIRLPPGVAPDSPSRTTEEHRDG
jgi:two-component system nitrogen regulation sensor histidine kinase NtrY